MVKNKIGKYIRRAGYTYVVNGKVVDSRRANGFLVHLPTGEGVTLDGNLLKSCYYYSVDTLQVHIYL